MICGRCGVDLAAGRRKWCKSCAVILKREAGDACHSRNDPALRQEYRRRAEENRLAALASPEVEDSALDQKAAGWLSRFRFPPIWRSIF
jgi:hypothetical protein